MKKTLITIFALLLGFFIFDRVLEKGLWWLHEHSKFSDDKPYLYVANDVNSDLAIILFPLLLKTLCRQLCMLQVSMAHQIYFSNMRILI